MKGNPVLFKAQTSKGCFETCDGYTVGFNDCAMHTL